MSSTSHALNCSRWRCPCSPFVVPPRQGDNSRSLPSLSSSSRFYYTWCTLYYEWLWIDYNVLYVIGVTRHTSLSCPRAWTAACDWTLQATAKGKDAHPRGDWIRSAIYFAIRLSISPLTVDMGKAGSPDPSVTVDRAFLSGNLKVFHVWVRHSEVVRSFQAQLYIIE